MSELVKTFPSSEQSRFQKGLEQFRLPYWDYFKPRYERNTVFPGIGGGDGRSTSFPYDFSLPRILSEETILVERPGSTQRVPMSRNPLRTFVFPTGSGSIPEADWKETSRFASSSRQTINFATDATVRHPRDSQQELSDELKANAVLNRNRESAVTNILDMIAGDDRGGRPDPYNSYATFASAAVTQGASGNLEDLHGNYHVIVGGTAGHMSHVPVAAFDPVFWMHHW